MSYELFFQDIIKGKRKGIIKAPLYLMSFLYRFAIFCRNKIYDHGWLAQYTPPVPLVISIGNIAVGGTGKTPVTIMLAKNFQNLASVAIASRGYRSEAEHLSSSVVVSKGQGPLFPASYCGDESFLLAENLPGIHVFAGKNRLQSSDMAAQSGMHLLILDDGFQHRQLARDFDIVLLDGSELNGQFLPSGPLRDSLKSLSRASLILLTGSNIDRTKIAKYTKAPIVEIQMKVDEIIDDAGKKVESIEGKKAGIFCGIGNPERFVNTVNSLGPEIVGKKNFPDHRLCEKALARFSDECLASGAQFLLCTEKDKVKLTSKFSLPIYWIKMEMEVVEGKDNWNLFIENVKKTLGVNRRSA